ncbi:MAG: ArnT family glycosyltransferase, partial [Parazoarcus communis]
MSNTLTRNPALVFLILLLPLASFFLRLGGAPLFDVDEGAFSEATREMFERGDFLSTYLNGEHRFDKPILVYWLQAIGFLLFGATEWAF